MSESESTFIDDGRASGEVAGPNQPEPVTITPTEPRIIPTPPAQDGGERQALSPNYPWLLENMAFRDQAFFEEWQELLKQQRAELFPPEAEEE